MKRRSPKVVRPTAIGLDQQTTGTHTQTLHGPSTTPSRETRLSSQNRTSANDLGEINLKPGRHSKQPKTGLRKRQRKGGDVGARLKFERAPTAGLALVALLRDDGGVLAAGELPELGQLQAEGDQAREGFRGHLVQLVLVLLVLLDVPGGASEAARRW